MGNIHFWASVERRIHYWLILFIPIGLFIFSRNATSLELSRIDEYKWTRCGGEMQLCRFDGRRIVRFGSQDRFKYIEANDEIRCSIGVFGDPAPRESKSCWYGEKIRPLASDRTSSIIKINVFVFDDDQLLNSNHWTRARIESVLAAASELLDNSLRFEISDFRVIIDNEIYATNKQNEILTGYLAKVHEYGRISMAISGPATVDSAGSAIQDSFIVDLKPKLVIRSRLNDFSKEDVVEVARIFLHELGHTLGFSHEGTLKSRPFNTDDWWFVDAARRFLLTLASWSTLRTDSTKKAITSFDCKVAGFEPDTNLFEGLRTRALDLDECAKRCLITDGCIAIAQGLWNNANCLLFTKGAQIIHRRQYNNANTCWLKGEAPTDR